MFPQLFAALFGGSVLGALSHMLYIKANSSNRTLAAVVDNVISPAVQTVASTALTGVAAGTPISGTMIGAAAANQVTVAALSAIQSALTGPHTQAPVAVPAAAISGPISSPSEPTTSAEDLTGDPNAPSPISATGF